MRRLRLPFLYLALAFVLMALVVGCVVWRARLTAPVRNDAQSELIFSHERHSDMDIECATCHVVSEESVSVAAMIPREGVCMTCHSREQGCELCHENANAVVPLRPEDDGLRFPHEPHLRPDVNPEGCATCHAGVERSTQVAEMFPSGDETCMTCHAQDMADATRCGQCHDRLTTATFVPASHDADWLALHADAAANDRSLCDVCHRGSLRADFVRGPEVPARPVLKNHAQNGDVSSCAECHRADLYPQRVHDANYLQSHPLDASLDATTCESCHPREECASCHLDRALTYPDVHPPDFFFSHAAQARQRLSTCTSCHEETTCLSCHQSTKPHPDEWDVEMTRQNAQLCGKCHTGGEIDE